MYLEEITARNGKFGLWLCRFGFVWFDTLLDAERELALHLKTHHSFNGGAVKKAA